MSWRIKRGTLKHSIPGDISTERHLPTPVKTLINLNCGTKNIKELGLLLMGHVPWRVGTHVEGTNILMGLGCVGNRL